MKTEFNTNKVLWNKFRGKLEWNELRIFLGEKGNEAGRGSLPMTGLRVALIIALLEIFNIIICMGFQIPKRMKYLNPSLPLYHLFKSTNFRTFLCYLLSSHRLKHILWLCCQYLVWLQSGFRQIGKKPQGIFSHVLRSLLPWKTGVNKRPLFYGQPRIWIWKNWAPDMHLWDFRRAGIHI